MDPPPFGVRRGSTEPRGGSPSTAQINPALDVGSTLVPLQTPGGLLTSLNGAKFDPKIKQLLKCWAISSSVHLYGRPIVPTGHLQAADPKFPPHQAPAPKFSPKHPCHPSSTTQTARTFFFFFFSPFPPGNRAKNPPKPFYAPGSAAPKSRRLL